MNPAQHKKRIPIRQLEKEAQEEARLEIERTLPPERSQDNIGAFARQVGLFEGVDVIVGAIRPRYTEAILNDAKRNKLIN